MTDSVEKGATAEQLPVPAASAAPADVIALLDRAIQSGVAVETLEKLVGLQERILDRQAEADFGLALAQFQAAQGPIPKTETVNIRPREGTPYSFRFAPLDHIAETIRPGLAMQGISYSFDTEFSEGYVKATCILRHHSGHSERTHFTAPIDPRARMNDPQKAASATTYAQRYALVLALGLTTGEVDDAGMAAGSTKITADQAARIRALLQEVGADEERFLVYMRVGDIADIPVGSFDLAIKALEVRRGRKEKGDA